MHKALPDEAIIENPRGSERLSTQDWLRKSNADKIQAITRREVRFFQKKKPIPIREALAAIATAKTSDLKLDSQND